MLSHLLYILSRFDLPELEKLESKSTLFLMSVFCLPELQYHHIFLLIAFAAYSMIQKNKFYIRLLLIGKKWVNISKLNGQIKGFVLQACGN